MMNPPTLPPETLAWLVAAIQTEWDSRMFDRVSNFPTERGTFGIDALKVGPPTPPVGSKPEMFATVTRFEAPSSSYMLNARNSEQRGNGSEHPGPLSVIGIVRESEPAWKPGEKGPGTNRVH